MKIERTFFLIALTLTLAAAVAARGQPSTQPATTQSADTQPVATQPATTQAAVTQPATVPVPSPAKPIPLPEVVTVADKDTAKLRAIDADLSADAVRQGATVEVPKLETAVDRRLQESGPILSGNPSLQTLKELADDWDADAKSLGQLTQDLTARVKVLAAHVVTTLELEKEWWGPNAAYARATAAPAEVVERAETMAAEAGRTRARAEQARDAALGLQSRASKAAKKTADALTAVRQAESAARNRVLVKDAPPLWSPRAWSPAAGGGDAMVSEGQRSLDKQLDALWAYADENRVTLVLHALAVLVLIPVLVMARRRVAAAAAEDPSLRRAAAVFDTPVAMAVLLTLLASTWLYPHAPRIFNAAIGAAALVPTVVILRRLLERRLLPLLYAMVAFYAVDQVRAVSGGLPLAGRLLLTGELAAAAAFLAWLLRSGRLGDAVDADRDALGKWVVIVARASTVIFIAAFLAAVLGYLTLAALMGEATLGGAYLAVILYAITRVVDGLAMGALRVRPLSLLKTVERHRRAIWLRARRAVQWAAVVVWVIVTLDQLSVRAVVATWLDHVWAAGFTVGAFSLSVGNVVAFALTVWATVLISRLTRFVLDEDVYPRLHLARGLPYAVSTVLHYAILLVGFVAAVGALGYDLTKFTILAGAFGVGLGFGLQNIFNNFVSGLILLFERPIKVGDVVQIGTDTGVVRRIGIRASVVRTSDGAEIILPNAKLIADPVTNWTLSGNGRGIGLQLAVANTAEPRQVMLIWTRACVDHPKVADDPPPRASLVGLSADALRFEMYAWTTEFESWPQTRGELLMAVHAGLTEAGIAVK